MIRIPFSATVSHDDLYEEIWRYLDKNCHPVGVIAQWSPDSHKRMYSLMNNYDNVWNVQVYVQYIEVSCHPTQHETYLALKYGAV